MIRRLAKFQRVIFDFDNTLFDAETIKEYFWKIAALHGLSKEETLALYRAARTEGGLITITIESFLTVMKKYLADQQREFLDRQVYELIEQMEKANTLLPGAKKLLEFCKTKNIERYVLSLGVPDWQLQKVKRAGLEFYFDSDKIIYTENAETGKRDVLKEMFGSDFIGQGTILFNDKPDETMELLIHFPELRMLVRREVRDMRYSKADFIQLEKQFPENVVWSDSLEHLIDVLKSLVN